MESLPRLKAQSTIRHQPVRRLSVSLALIVTHQGQAVHFIAMPFLQQDRQNYIHMGQSSGAHPCNTASLLHHAPLARASLRETWGRYVGRIGWRQANPQY